MWLATYNNQTCPNLISINVKKKFPKQFLLQVIFPPHFAYPFPRDRWLILNKSNKKWMNPRILLFFQIVGEMNVLIWEGNTEKEKRVSLKQGKWRILVRFSDRWREERTVLISTMNIRVTWVWMSKRTSLTSPIFKIIKF